MFSIVFACFFVHADVINQLYKPPPHKTSGLTCPLISEEFYSIVMENADRINSCIVYDRDYMFDYFSFKLLESKYLLRIDDKVVERPQHMFMRLSIAIHGRDIDAAIETYNLLSEKYLIHSPCALSSAGTPNAQLSESYTLMMPSDSIEGIFGSVSHCLFIEEQCGTIGLNVHNIRAKGSYIAGTNGVSNGLVPMLRVFNHSSTLFKDELSPGSITIYLEPWHADIFTVLAMKGSGKDELRGRDLSYALWIPDLFMKRVENNEKWSLMCPDHCKGLSDVWGDKFNELYEKYESDGNFIKQIDAQVLWQAIIKAQIETGMPSILYKDACNRKSNQQNVGIIRGGNFTADIIQYSSPNEAGVCNIGFIPLNKFVKSDKKSYDFEKLKDVTKVLTNNLNKLIENNNYPLTEAENSALLHRAIGIGVQGLADTFIAMRLSFESEEAAMLNKQIFETIYYGALEASCELAAKDGSYPTFKGSPASKGQLQYNLWGVTPSDLWNWDKLKQQIAHSGLRNSLLVSCTNCTETSLIFGNNLSVNPLISNLNNQTISTGEIQLVNQNLVKDLDELNLWNATMMKDIISHGGSIEHIASIPNNLKELYKTAWDISQKTVINMALDRGAFIDHSQALDIHIKNTNYGVITSMHFYGWKKGLKTGMHSLQIKSTSDTHEKPVPAKIEEKNNVDLDMQQMQQNMAALVCSLENPESCEMCGA